MSTERPILDWYDELPEPYRTQAKANYDPGFAKYWNGMASSQHDALTKGFMWQHSRQGDLYWRQLKAAIENGTPLPIALAALEAAGPLTQEQRDLLAKHGIK